MCGIAGFTTLRHAPGQPSDLIRRMTDRLQPRGPDGSGVYSDAAVQLGHRRLSIIDLGGGAQPLAVSGGRFQIIFNGEIYNYIELRRDLEARGVVFATSSDTEVLLHQIALDGLDGLQKLNGMFAFAVWDRDRRELLIARDRLGIKPLYFLADRGELAFASELKALLLHPGARRDIDLLSVSKYLTFGYIPAPHTIFRGIRKLQPGCWLRWSESGLEQGCYWDIPLEDNPLAEKPLDELSDDLLALLRDVVRKQLRSDVPVGVFLSGGVDSSSVVALAANEVQKPLHTFSVGFEEASYDESPYARMVSQQYGTEHHHEVLSQSRAVGLLPRVLDTLDEPFGDASILPTYLLSEFTARHVKVVLGGDGGDELFAGYPSFQAHVLMEKLSVLPVTWRNALVRIARRIPVSHSYASLDFLLQQFFKGAGISPEIRFFLWMGPFGNELKRSVLSASTRDALLRENPFEDVLNYVRQSGLVSDFQRILYLCAKLYMQDGILVKVDRASMANSLEVRVPLLDHTLVEFAARIPQVYKLKGMTTKYILKHAMRGLLPKQIIQRRKAGFMIPLAQWLEKDLRPMVEDLCSDASIARDGIFDSAGVRRMLDEHFRHQRDHRKAIWTLMTFQHWRRMYGG